MAFFVQTLWPWIKTLEPMEKFILQQILIQAVTCRFLDFQRKLLHLLKNQSSRVKKDIRYILKVMRTPVYAQKLSMNGSGLFGKRTKIIENDQKWEAHLVEGVWVTKCKKKYFLFYAGNDFSTNQYGIGLAIASSPLGPYRKIPKPFLGSTSRW